MAYYTEKQIEQARSIDLLTYLQTYEPTELVYIRGDTYCTREHDSLKISNGKWYWWSRGFGASSALDYLIKVQGMKFTEAMKILTDGAKAHSFYTKMESDSRIVENKRLLLPERSETTREITRYLTGRGIDRNLIEACIHRGVLFESLPYHSCVFVGYDPEGIARYACYRSTNHLKMMGDIAGSDKSFSFRNSTAGRKLHVFESPIDMLSFMTVGYIRDGIWNADPMLSLGGVYMPSEDPEKRKLPIALKNMLQDHNEVTGIALHLDNDEVGKAAAWSIEGLLRNKYNIAYEPAPYGKDYNDYLMYLRRMS